MKRRVLTGLVCGIVCTLATTGVHASRDFDFGPIASRMTDVHGESHLRVLGPLFETAESTNDMDFLAVRPLFSRVDDPPRDRTAKDYLWPIATHRSLENDANWRWLIFFGFNHDTSSNAPRKRLWLVPFYFQGRDAEGKTYRALFPIYGSIHEFIGRDSIDFALFPLHVRTSLNDLRSTSWLWPIYSKTTGEKTYRWRVFPLYSYSRRDGEFVKRSVVWPIWTQVRYDHPGSSGKGFILFPLYGHMKLEDQETWWVIPPFFRYTQGKKADMLLAPWPFIQWRKEKDAEKFYIWPLWGHKKLGNLDQTFYLWPIFWKQHIDRNAKQQDRFTVVPFYFGEKTTMVTSNEPPEVVGRISRLWPLYSYRRVGDASRFRMVELWPFAETGGIERNWAPLWTLYSRKAKGDNVDIELLWGLYRQQHREGGADYVSLFPLADWRDAGETNGRSGWSLLKGLIGYERDDSRKRLRLLYFLTVPLGKESKP